MVTENNGNITLYAVWIEGEPVNYAVEHYLQTKDLSSYEKSEKNSNTLQNVAGKEVTAQPESIDGFTFDKTNPENITSGTVSADSKLVLKLYYNRNKYTVTFDKNSKTASGEMEPQIFYYDVDETRKLNENKFTDEYHEFLGWAKTADTTKDIIKDAAELDFDITKSSDELSLYAVWSAADPAVIKELTVRIPDSDKDLENKAVISTSRNISVTFSAENAVKVCYSLGEESKEIKEESLDFADLTDGNYTFKVWAENIDGVKSEERTFSWTMACSPKLKIKGIPDSIIKIDTEVNIDVSGDNLESCSYSLNDGDSKEITLTDNAGKFTIKNNTAGDFTLTITGKNKLDETTEETFNWTVVETPVAVLSEIPQSLDSDTTFDITVSECDYYKYCLNSDEWSDVLESTTPIKIKDLVANETYILKVIGGNIETYEENGFNWQSKETPTTVTWQIPSISLGDVLSTAYKVTGDEGIDGKNIYAHSDNNFIYFGYLDQKNEQQFCYNDLTKITALCVGIYSDTKESEIFNLNGIDQDGNKNQPSMTVNSQKLSHFVRIVFDSETSGKVSFYTVKESNWVETTSVSIATKIMKGGQCVMAIPRSLLNNPKSYIKYVFYIRDYNKAKIYAGYPDVTLNDSGDYRIENEGITLSLQN